MGGLCGAMQGGAMDNSVLKGMESGVGKTALRFAFSAAAYGVEFLGASHIKANYYGLSTKGWQTKVGISGYKSLMYSLMLN